jgi:hypothetical protein
VPTLAGPPQDAAAAMGAYVLLMHLPRTASCQPLTCQGTCQMGVLSWPCRQLSEVEGVAA